MENDRPGKDTGDERIQVTKGSHGMKTRKKLKQSSRTKLLPRK